MNEIQNINKEELKLKRLLGIDFGMARVGLALSDAFIFQQHHWKHYNIKTTIFGIIYLRLLIKIMLVVL